MAYWIMLLGFLILLPLTMIFLGLRFINKPPKKINYIYGYRTTMSMKNTETWLFAHHYLGKIWWKLGFVALVISVIPVLFVIGASEESIDTVAITVIAFQAFFLILSIIPVEIALRKEFDTFGRRKNRIET